MKWRGWIFVVVLKKFHPYTLPMERRPQQITGLDIYYENRRDFNASIRTITPVIPIEGKGKDVVVQHGLDGGFFVRVQTLKVSTADLNYLLTILEKQRQGAVYVGLSENVLPLNGNHFLRFLFNQQYTFHHRHEETKEQFYYKWTRLGKDLVPSYATSIESSGILCLSPDEREVLLIRDSRGPSCYWKCIGGPINAGETCLEGALRACRLNIQVKIDDLWAPQLLLTANKKKARDELINSHFMLFVCKALSKDICLDDGDVIDAQWVSVDMLSTAWIKLCRYLSTSESSSTLLISGIEEPYQSVGCMELMGVHHLLKSHTFSGFSIDGEIVYENSFLM